MTPEQTAVAQAAPDQLSIVQAGAGTGKTHTLASRLEFLAGRAGSGTGEGLLVLSFSRAAVKEVRRRVVAGAPSLPYLPIHTFDSYATWLLDSHDPDGAWTHFGYDGRILAATAALDDPTNDLGDGLQLRHVLIDEAQDLVGIRALFALSLLRRTEAAFTVFGDAAQAIYGFRGAGGDSAEPGPSFIDRLDEVSAGRKIEQFRLTAQMRAGSESTRRVMRMGSELADSDGSQETVGRNLHELIESIPPLSGLGAIRRRLTRTTETTAILTRTNAQALVVAEQLHAMDIPFRIQPAADDKAIGSWLAALAAQANGNVVSRSRFGSVMQDLGVSEALAAELWIGLVGLDPRGRGEVDLRRLAARLRQTGVPDSLGHRSDARIVVSTIHRAKGLEFENVIVCPLSIEKGEPAEERRVLYVGLSRARRDLFVLRGLKAAGMRMERDRVVVGGFGRSAITAIEVRGPDSASPLPAGASLRDGDPSEIQAYLLSSVQPGDLVDLLLADPSDSRPWPCYRITHAGRTVGETSERMAGDLRKALGRRGSFPASIEGLRVQMVESAAGDEQVGRSADLSSYGFWARVRIEGMGRFGIEEKFAHG